MDAVRITVQLVFQINGGDKDLKDDVKCNAPHKQAVTVIHVDEYILNCFDGSGISYVVIHILVRPVDSSIVDRYSDSSTRDRDASIAPGNIGIGAQSIDTDEWFRLV